ncbi:hypothetical protein BDR06DRAFT_960253, partial [Suillus hirtellus]
MSDTPSGRFKIANVAYPYRYVSMSDDKQLVGQDDGNVVRVHHHSNVLPMLINARRSRSMS